jgi:putative transcriptional regulator
VAVPPLRTQGRLLLATPQLADPNFDRTVVLVLEHHDSGALGVVINRPSDEMLTGALDRWQDLLAPPRTVFAGGPVELEAMLALAVGDTTPDESLSEHLSQVAPAILSVDLASDPALLAGVVSDLRVFRGYAGWGPTQLDDEIDEGAWLVLDADPSDLTNPDPERLWRSILRRQSGRLAWLANAPDDLSAN